MSYDCDMYIHTEKMTLLKPLKIQVDTDLKIILLGHNYYRKLKHDDQCYKKVLTF